MPIRIRYIHSAPEIVAVALDEDGWSPPLPQMAAMFVLPFVDDERESPTASDDTGWTPQPYPAQPYFVLPQIEEDLRGASVPLEDYWLRFPVIDGQPLPVKAFAEEFAEGDVPPPATEPSEVTYSAALYSMRTRVHTSVVR